MKSCRDIALLASDLDGTLKKYDCAIDTKTLDTLHRLGEDGVVRVIATGRNQNFAREVLSDDFPIDYLIFSSGAGIVRWCDGALLASHTIDPCDMGRIVELLKEQDIDFMLYKAIPEEHYFYYQQQRKTKNPATKDFQLRLKTHKEWSRPFSTMPERIPCTQALGFMESDVARFTKIASLLDGFTVVRTTSPTTPESDGVHVTWIEIFEKSVSKGAAVLWLCEQLGIAQEATLGFGNDYNDLDLLEATAQSWVVENAPPELQERFSVCSGLPNLMEALQRSHVGDKG